MYLNTGKLLVLSPQHMLECTRNPYSCGGSGGCEGATCELGFDMAKHGLATAESVPYLGKDAVCAANVSLAARTTGHVTLPSNQFAPLLHHIVNVGPLAITVDASAWQLYESGIFNGCDTSKLDLDHAVQLVGVNVDADGEGYYLVRNSWGVSWGENGFIRLYLGKNETCATDSTPGDGIACKGDNSPEKVCGTCGILFDTSYPTGAALY